MSLSPALAGSSAWADALPSTVITALAVLAYALAAWAPRVVHTGDEGSAVSLRSRLGSVALLAGWLLHMASLVVDIGGDIWLLAALASDSPVAGTSGPRLGFAPVLSASVWLVIAVHEVEARLVPVPVVRIGLALAGAAVTALAWLFPGEARPFASAFGPWHFVLGVAAYALVAAAALHGLWLGAAEARLRHRRPVDSASAAATPVGARAVALGMPLLQLERLTFRFIQAGFVLLSLTLLLGLLTPVGLKLEHKTVFSLLAWAAFAILLWGRIAYGWRGRLALRWLYGGTLLLLLAYVGSRFVSQVLLGRPW